MEDTFYNMIRNRSDSVYNSRIEKAGTTDPELGFGPEAAAGSLRRERHIYPTRAIKEDGLDGELGDSLASLFEDKEPHFTGDPELRVTRKVLSLNDRGDEDEILRHSETQRVTPEGDVMHENFRGTPAELQPSTKRLREGFPKKGPVPEGMSAGDPKKYADAIRTRVENEYDSKFESTTKSFRDIMTERNA